MQNVLSAAVFPNHKWHKNETIEIILKINGIKLQFFYNEIEKLLHHLTPV